MAILDGFDKQKRYITDIDKNHKLVSEWTHSDTVEFADGETLTVKESDIEDRLDAAEESLTHKLGDTGEQVLDGIFRIKDTEGAISTGLMDTPRLALNGRAVQGYNDQNEPSDLYLNLNGGKVYIGREINQDTEESYYLRQVATYEQEPTQWVYDEWGNQIGDPDTYIPRIMVTSQQKGQIISSGYAINKVEQKMTGRNNSLKVLLSEDITNENTVGSTLKTNKLMFNPYLGDLSIDNNLQVGGGIELGAFVAASVPYIDFHYNTTSQTDYTSRIIAESNSTFNFKGLGGVWATLYAGAFTQASSENVKTNIEDITDAEAKKLLQLRPVSFDYKYTNVTNQRGLIAEEVQEIYPEMVFVPDGYTEFDPERPDVVPSIDYSKFVPYLIKMIQIQQAEIDELKSKID